MLARMGYNVLEEMRMLSVQRIREGASPTAPAASIGMHRGWAYKCRAADSGRSKGLRALRSTKGTNHPRSLTPVQERQVLRWVDGKNPRQYGFDFGQWVRQIQRELGSTFWCEPVAGEHRDIARTTKALAARPPARPASH